MRARSVHGFGLAEPLGVAFLDRAGAVCRTGVLFPRRILCDRGARWVVEVPLSRGLPTAGEIVALVPARSSRGRAAHGPTPPS
jgi:hypothetical protein